MLGGRHITHFNAFVDPGNQPAKQAAVEIFGKCVSGVVGLQTNASRRIKRHLKKNKCNQKQRKSGFNIQQKEMSNRIKTIKESFCGPAAAYR